MNRIYKLHDNLKRDCFNQLPVVIKVTEFNDTAYGKFSEQFELAHNTGQSVIPIVIDSYGGYVYSLMGMVSLIKNTDIPVATIFASKSMSCGAVLFSCGTEGMRYISPYATLMVHSVSSWAVGKVDDMEISVDEARRLNKEIYTIMEENIGKKKGTLLKHIKDNCNNGDWFLTPAEAKEWNFANHIGIPSFNVSVDIKTELALKHK